MLLDCFGEQFNQNINIEGQHRSPYFRNLLLSTLSRLFHSGNITRYWNDNLNNWKPDDSAIIVDEAFGTNKLLRIGGEEEGSS